MVTKSPLGQANLRVACLKVKVKFNVFRALTVVRHYTSNHVSYIEFQIVPDEEADGLIKSLHISCTFECDNGKHCEWYGLVRHLEVHYNVT